MQRPPAFTSPHVLSVRPIQEWIGRINQAHKQLCERALPDDAQSALAAWTETHFVHSTLRLDGMESALDRVARIVSSGSPLETTAEPDRPAARLLGALREIETLAREKRAAAELTSGLVLHLGDTISTVSSFRSTPGNVSGPVKPVAVEHLAAAIESACRWFGADSFAELNPIEQSAIVLLRLIEIQPFEERNVSVALLASSLFTLRSGLPGVIIKPDRAAAFWTAQEEGFRMNTRPMVELVAESILEALTEMLNVAEGKTGK